MCGVVCSVSAVLCQKILDLLDNVAGLNAFVQNNPDAIGWREKRVQGFQFFDAEFHGGGVWWCVV